MVRKRIVTPVGENGFFVLHIGNEEDKLPPVESDVTANLLEQGLARTALEDTMHTSKH